MKWEYKTLKHDASSFLGRLDAQGLQDQFNGLGQEGWELVSTFENRETRDILVIFKRPLS